MDVTLPRVRYILETLSTWQRKTGAPVDERMLLKLTQAGYREVRDALELCERKMWVRRLGEEGPWELLPPGAEVLTVPRAKEAAFPIPFASSGAQDDTLDYDARMVLGALREFKRQHPGRTMPTPELLPVTGLHYEPAYEAAEGLRDKGLVTLIDLDEGPRGKVPIDFELDLP